MTTREKLIQAALDLPEDEVPGALEYIASRGRNGTGEEPLVTEEEQEPNGTDDPDDGGETVSLRTVDDWERLWGEPEMVGLPEHLRTFEDGTPVPNWVAGLDEVRHGH